MQCPYGVRRRKNHKHFVFMKIGEFFLCPIAPDLRSGVSRGEWLFPFAGSGIHPYIINVTKIVGAGFFSYQLSVISGICRGGFFQFSILFESQTLLHLLKLDISH